MLEHTHAIIIIKNDKDEYLQYFDERWNCYLFPNCKLTDENHITIIKNYISQQLNFECATKNILYVTDKVHEKYSISANKMKKYHHYFYEVVKCNEFVDNNQSKNFTINDLNCSWFSIPELESNERIQKVNKDIVDFIKQIEQLN